MASNLVNEVEDRLADLFGEGENDTPDVETAAEFDDTSSEIEDTPILENDDGDIEDTPLNELKSIVLSIDWEISDDIMTRFLEQINGLKETFKEDRIIQMFLQLLFSVGKYIKAKKENSDPDVVNLLNSAYAGLEQVVLTKEITEHEKKTLIITEVNKFKKVREKLKGEPAGDAKGRVRLSKEDVTSEPGPEAAVEEIPVTISTGKSKGLGLGSKINLIVLLPLIFLVTTCYIYIRQLTDIPSQIDQLIQTYSGVSLEEAKHIVFGIFCGLFILIGLIASVYAHRQAGKVKALTRVVECINAGEAVPEIKVKSRGEIGALAEAIGHWRKA